MARLYDVAVVGLGAMGSATAYHLAKRGVRVLGLEQFTPAHDRGSSHGRSRIIRQAYHEGPGYVPLLRRAYELWRELERETGRELLLITGGLMIGGRDSEVVNGAAESARLHHLSHEILDAADLRRRFPTLHIADDQTALFEAEAGVLFPEDCVRAHLDRAAALGADLRFETPMLAWRHERDGVQVVAGSDTWQVDRMVVTAGAWAGRVLAQLGLPLQPERNVVYWFDPGVRSADFAPGQFPIFIWDHPERTLYGLPDVHGDGVKVGFHHTGVVVDPDRVQRQVGNDEIAAIRRRIAECIPVLDRPPRAATVCLYTNTPDEHFAIGLHPEYPHLAVAAGFSGHGFKFASVVGEILADLATRGRTSHPIAMFSPDRFR